MPATENSGPAQRLKMIYVSIMLKLLPHLLNLTKHVSKPIKAECDYLPADYTFQLAVEGTHLTCVVMNCGCETMRSIPVERRATDVEPGSGQTTAQEGMKTIDYVISFRSLDYAFACFSGGKSLQEALAERAFSTRGPNNTGVSLTYMFTALLRMFFFWRKPYRAKKQTAVN